MPNDTRPILFTLCEGDYHHGVAALINSACNVGFRGLCVVGYRGPLPPWSVRLRRADTGYFAGETEVEFVSLNPDMHFGYFKPFFACDLLNRFPNASAILYADPDILFLAPWEFFDDWIIQSQAVGLCADQNFINVDANHPWRQHWVGLLETAGFRVCNSSAPYINSGFVGVSKSYSGLWTQWCEVTNAFQRQGGDLSRFRMAERWRAIVGDQDLLAASLMAWPTPISLLGSEGMGFNGDFKFICHAVEQPKPWKNNRIWMAMKGYSPSAALRIWRRHCQGPIATRSPLEERVGSLDLSIANAISRIYRR